MILRLTAKLGKKISSMPTQTLALSENPFADWVGNLFIANRVQYIMLSNTASLYSIILRGNGITGKNKLFKQVQEVIGQFMCDDGLEFIFSRLIAPHAGKVQYSKTGDRAVLGSMNDMIRIASFYLTERQMSPFEAAKMINDMPMSLLQYNHPRECFTAMTPNDGNAGLMEFLRQKSQSRKDKLQNRHEDNAMTKWQAILPGGSRYDYEERLVWRLQEHDYDCGLSGSVGHAGFGIKGVLRQMRQRSCASCRGRLSNGGLI